MQTLPSRAATQWVSTMAKNLPPATSKKSVTATVQSAPTLTHRSKHQTFHPWFAKSLTEVDLFTRELMPIEVDKNHPGYTDLSYRQRMDKIAQMANDYKHGQQITRVQYTAEDVQTWGKVYSRLTKLYPQLACQQYNQILPLMQKHCGYRENHIPQLQDISDFLQGTTGFRVRPVSGFLTSRQFLNGLALKVFHSTQYIRHQSSVDYTPEPDVIHEIMGHAPMFADKDFAELSQEIGLASLGASDEEIKQLATIYWYTVEFGVCMQGKERKACGAGLLGSVAELQYSMGRLGPEKQPTIERFELERVLAIKEFPYSEFQHVYFETESFEDTKKHIRKFSQSFNRPFKVKYDSSTESVQIQYPSL